jgi:hypothetical protein
MRRGINYNPVLQPAGKEMLCTASAIADGIGRNARSNGRHRLEGPELRRKGFVFCSMLVVGTLWKQKCVINGTFCFFSHDLAVDDHTTSR